MSLFRKSLVVFVLAVFALLWAQTPSPQWATGDQQPEHRISATEADELFRAVDDILKIQSEDTGLPIKRRIKRQLTSREQVQKFLLDRFKKDEQAQRLQSAEVVLKKFGLVPRDFYLEGFLLQLLTEEVAGYYDPKTRTVYLLDWVDPDLQKPVLAHELTHALQDQSVGVEKWARQGPDKKQSGIASDEQIAARQAVLEGQAMLAMMDYSLAPRGQSVMSSPEMVKAAEAGMDVGEGPTFRHAPLYVKKSIVFPYTYGLEFERQLRQKGRERAFIGALRNPPQDTRHIMQPATYLAGDNVPPLAIPDFGKLLGKGFERVDLGSIGEFDVMIMATVYANDDAAQAIFPQWRGGYYYAARQKGTRDGPLALLFVTKWGSKEAAAKFGELYSAAVRKRYGDARPVPTPTSAASGRGVLQWETNQGPVEIEIRGDTVVAAESIDLNVARPAIDAGFAAAQATTKTAAAASPELVSSILTAPALAALRFWFLNRLRRAK